MAKDSVIKEEAFLVEAGISGLPFPVKVNSKGVKEGQDTVAAVSVRARIMRDFEPRWIDKFIQILHRHALRLGTNFLSDIVHEYLTELQARNIRIEFEYPYFIERTTPVSKEKCLVSYACNYMVTAFAAEEPVVNFRIKVPAITTYPASRPDVPGGLFGQLSIVDVQVEVKTEVYAEDFVDLVERYALSPVYSFHAEEDQLSIIQKVHTEVKTSVSLLDKVRSALSRNREVIHYSVQCANFGMLHSYSTVISVEKSPWVPFSTLEG